MSSPDVLRPDVVRELQASRLIYPFYRTLIEHFDLEMFPCKDLEEQSADSPEVLTRVRLWFSEADKHIEVTQIRQHLQANALDEPMLRFLIWRHVAKQSKTDSDRYKVDFLLGNYLAMNMPADLTKGDVRVAEVASVLEPVVGESEYLTYVEDLEECVRELKQCQHLQDLLERNILERGRTLKAGAGETFFHQAGLIAFTRFNFLTRRRVVDLLNTDLEEVSSLISELQLRGLQSLDCTAAGLGATETIDSLRDRVRQWRKPFQGKYSEMEWLQQISNLRKLLKAAMEHYSQAQPAVAAVAAAGLEPRLGPAISGTKVSQVLQPSAPLVMSAAAAKFAKPAPAAAKAVTDAAGQPAASAAADANAARIVALPEKPPPPDLKPKPAGKVQPKSKARLAPRRPSAWKLLLERVKRWYTELLARFAKPRTPALAVAPVEKPATAVATAKHPSDGAPRSTPATGRIVQPSARVPEAIKRVSEQVATLAAEADGAITITISGIALHLSARELTAFRKTNENLSGIFQRSAAVRLLLTEALSKAGDADGASLAPMLKFAYSESTLLQGRVAQAKNNKDVDGAVALTACLKALSTLMEKVEEGLTRTVAAAGS